MELREPPVRSETARPDPLVRVLLVLILLAVLGLGAAWLLETPGLGRGGSQEAAQRREVAAKLKAAGALDQAAELYAESLGEEGGEGAGDGSEGARIAYSLGTMYLESGQPEKALRWFYEAETRGAGELSEELSKKIVHTLERMGRRQAAQAALESRVNLAAEAGEVRRPAEDPVVAKVGPREIHRSDLDRYLDDLPPELAASMTGREGREELLRHYVADELLWAKAVKLEYDRDEEVLRRHDRMLRQLAVAKLVEDEVVKGVKVDPTDLESFFVAHKDRYRKADAKEDPKLEDVRPLVERDYRLSKIEAGYNQMIQSELAAADVELFPERLTDGT